MDDLTTGKILLRKRKGCGPHLHVCYICLDHISIVILEMGYSVICGIVNGCCFWLDLSHYTAISTFKSLNNICAVLTKL